MSKIYNPASLRVKESSGGVDLGGVVCLILPDGTVVDAGRGAVFIDVVAAASGSTIYRLSDTLGDGSITTFAFTPQIGTLKIAFVNGVAMDPADVSVVAGDLVLGAGITPPGDPLLLAKVAAEYVPV